MFIGINMKKTITSFAEFKRIIARTYLKGYDVCWTQFGFYYFTHKCRFFYSCRSTVDRMRVFEFFRNNQIKHYKIEVCL